MIRTRDDAMRKVIGDSCNVLEYNLPSEEFSLAVVVVEGSLPESGAIVNHECAETFYVVSGSGRFQVGNASYEAEVGDVVTVEKGYKLKVRGFGLCAVVVCVPPWYAEQHEFISE